MPSWHTWGMATITKTPQGTWRVRGYDADGVPYDRTRKTRKEAAALLLDYENRKAAGEPLASDRQETTVGTFYRDVLLTRRDVSGSTIDGYARRWAPKSMAPKAWHLEQKWGRTALRKVTVEAVQRWHEEMEFAGASDATMFRAHDLLTTIIGYAVKRQYLPRNVIQNLSPDYSPDEVRDPWLPDRIERVRWAYMARHLHPSNKATDPHYAWRRYRDAMAVSFMGYAALRPGEAFALQWPMLLTGRTVLPEFEVTARVPHNERDPEARLKTTRRGRRHQRERVVSVRPALRQDVLEWWMHNGRPNSGYVLPVEPGGARLDHVALGNWSGDNTWGHTLRLAGVEHRPPKHLRMSCISGWIREERHRYDVADMAGHTLDTLESHYRRSFLDLKATSKLDIDALIVEARTAVEGTPLRKVG